MRLNTSSNRDSRNEKWQFEDELGSNLRRNGGRFDEMTRVSFYTNIKCRIFDNINERPFIREEKRVEKQKQKKTTILKILNVVLMKQPGIAKLYQQKSRLADRKTVGRDG